MPECFKSYVVCKCLCARCNSCYVGRTYRHFNTRMDEHLTGNYTHVSKHLKANPLCKEICNTDCFQILDHAKTKIELKFKEGIHIKWERPDLNKQKKHVIITLLI